MLDNVDVPPMLTVLC